MQVFADHFTRDVEHLKSVKTAGSSVIANNVRLLSRYR